MKRVMASGSYGVAMMEKIEELTAAVGSAEIPSAVSQGSRSQPTRGTASKYDFVKVGFVSLLLSKTLKCRQCVDNYQLAIITSCQIHVRICPEWLQLKVSGTRILSLDCGSVNRLVPVN